MVVTQARPPAERFIALDSLRGLAAVAVMLFHIGNFGWLGGFLAIRHGWLLVDFFFVLSGFVIAASYGERLAQGFSGGKFMALRLGRVVPLHAAVFAVWVAAEFLVYRPHLGEAHDTFYLWRGGLLLDGFAEHTGNFFAPVSWSISVEIVLYVAAALLFGRGRSALAITIAITLAAAAALALLTEWNYVGFGRLMQRGVLGFAIGTACYGLHRRLSVAASRQALTFAEIAVIAAAVALMAWLPFAMRTIVPLDLLFGAVVLVFARDAGLISRLLQTPPMVRLGTLSYSIYMTHLIVVIGLSRGLPLLFDALGRRDLVTPSRFGLETVELGLVWETLLVAAICAVVVAISAVTYRWIEEPARQWTRRQVSGKRIARGETAVAAI